MASALRKLSFDVVTLENGTRATIGSALLEFNRRLTASDLALVFYAGHGVQVEGVNYLVPVEFDGLTEDEVRFNAISSEEVTRALSRARVGVLVLDACRDNPYSGQRSGSGGLAQLEAKGILVAFATGAGQTASDGQGTANGVFTTELVRLLGTPGRGLRDTFFEVQRRVQRSTNGRQFPAVYSQLIDDVVLTPGEVVESAPSSAATELALRAELELWDAIKNSATTSVFHDYLNRYPNGQFRAAAEDRIRSDVNVSRPTSPTPSSTAGNVTSMPSSIAPPVSRENGPLQKAEINQVVALADRFMAAPYSPSNFGLSLQPFFMKSQESRAFVPFVLTLTDPPRSDSVMYVRVAPKGQPSSKSYPWDDVSLILASELVGNPARIHRVFMAQPGTYDVYVSLIERGGTPSASVARIGLLKSEISVPDFWNAQLSTSTFLVADLVRTLSAPPSEEQARKRPFVFGLQELLPASDMAFRKSEEISLFFQVYNASLESTGRPNLTMEYDFYKVDGNGEKFFNKTNPQFVDASNLPPQFDPAKFPVPGGITVPLGSFTEGSYRLNVKITDKANNNKILSQDIKFTVKG